MPADPTPAAPDPQHDCECMSCRAKRAFGYAIGCCPKKLSHGALCTCGSSSAAPDQAERTATAVRPAAPRNPVIPAPRLTPTQAKVARLVSMGCDYATIGERLGMATRTAECHVQAIAQKLPNPDSLKPYTLVILWAAHMRWLEERRQESAA